MRIARSGCGYNGRSIAGLLGTASGLVLIFGNTEDLTSGVNNAKMKG